jgi:hypothetical protein
MVDHGVSERVIDAVIAGRPEQVEEWLASIAARPAPGAGTVDRVGVANRGKIRSPDPTLNNLVALPNELICQVLAYTWG